MSKLRLTATTFAFFAGAVAMCCLRLPSSSNAVAADPGNPPELAKLQQEQVATLREASSLANQMFAHGVCPASDVDRINHMLTGAELDAADSQQERVQILQKAIDAAKKQEDLASELAKRGIVSALAPLEAKSYRLGLEVQFSKESSK